VWILRKNKAYKIRPREVFILEMRISLIRQISDGLFLLGINIIEDIYSKGTTEYLY